MRAIPPVGIGESRTVWRRIMGTASASAVTQLTLVVTGVFLARAMGPSDRGHFAIFTLAVLLATQLGTLGLQFALAYFVARDQGAARSLVNMIRNRYVVVTGATMIGTALIVAKVTESAPGYVTESLPWLVASIPVVVLHQAMLALLQGLEKFQAFNVVRVAPNAVFAALLLGAFALNETGYVTIALLWFASRLSAVCVALVPIHREWHKLPWIHTEVKQRDFTRVGYRSVLAATSPAENYRVDQLAVATLLPSSALGLYVVASAFTNVLRFAGQSIGLVATPHVARASSRQEAKERMWRFLGLALMVITPGGLLLALAVPPLVVPIFGGDYAGAEPLVLPLIVAASFYGLRRALSDAARGAGYPLAASVVEAIGLVAAIGLFALLIPSYGVHGAAWGLAGSAALSFMTLCVLLYRPDRFDKTVSSTTWNSTPAKGASSNPQRG